MKVNAFIPIFNKCSLIISTVLLLCLVFTACDPSGTVSPDISPSGTNNPDPTVIEPDDSDRTILTWVMDGVSAGVLSNERVAAFNNLLGDKGVDFTVRFVGIEKYAAEYNHALRDYLAAGNPADIMFTGFIERSYEQDPYGMCWQYGFLSCLDDYLMSEAGQKLYACYDDREWDALRINGKIYGLPVTNYYGSSTGYIVQRDVAETTKLDLSELTADMRTLRKPLESIQNWDSSLYPLDLHFGPSFLGYEVIGGCIVLDPNDPERGAFNYFKDDATHDCLLTLQSFYDEGYIKPIPLYGDSSPISLGNSIQLFGMGDSTYQFIPLWDKRMETYTNALSISSSTENINSAMLLLEMLHTDQELADMLVYGRKDIDYKVTDGFIIPLSDEAGTTFLLHFTGLFFNTSPSIVKGVNDYELFKEYNKDIELTPVTGFHFNSSGWENVMESMYQILADISYTYSIDGIDDLPENYDPNHGLLTGHNPDPEGALAQINEALKGIGLDALIEEVNRQYAEWRQYAPK